MLSYGAVMDGRGLQSVILPVVQERVAEWRWDMHPMWWMWGAGGLVMMLMMLVFWAVVIAGLVLGVRWLLFQGRTPTHDSALAILRERYARGEINREEFEARRRDLEGSSRG
jgi:putative membrane protein